MLMVLFYFLLFLALNCQLSLEQATYGCPPCSEKEKYGCPQRTCNGKTGAPPPPPLFLQSPPPSLPPPPPPPPPSPPPPPPQPVLPKEEVDAVNSLLQLLWTSSTSTTTSFDSTGCHSVYYSPVLTCNCFNGNTCTVTAIYLTGRDLRGHIPPEIGNLSNLQSMSLGSNKLRGTIPNSFGSLSQLSYLDLCNNMLGGPIPNFLGQLKSLRSLYLCNNGFNGSIPHELGSLPLEYLSLYNNDLSGELPVELGHISSLIGLYLSDNLLNGTLPEELGNLKNLQHMYLMNNFFNGELPRSFEDLTNLTGFNIRGNNISGTIPRFISKWQNIVKLILMGNNFEGPLPTEISALTTLTYFAVNDLSGGGTDVLFPDIRNLLSLEVLMLRNCSLTGPIPDFVWQFNSLSYLDLSFNSLTGEIPAVVNLTFPEYIFLRSNNLRGLVPGWLVNLSESYVDISENSFTSVTLPSGNISSNLNLFSCCSKLSNVGKEWQKAGYSCDSNTPTHDQLYINCGGNATSVNGNNYEADLQPFGGSTFFLSNNKTWAYSSMGTFLEAVHDNYILNSECNIPNTDTSLYLNARIAPISLKYYGFCLKNDNYTVRLHFAEIGWDTKRVSRIRKRIFNVDIQGGQHYLKDFDLEKEAGKFDKVIPRDFNVSVNDSRLEIHLYWSGKGSTLTPTKYYGPLISAITVFPVPREPSRRPNKIPPLGIAGIVGSTLVFGILILALFRALGWFGRKKLKEGLELYPGGVFDFHKLKAATNNFDPDKRIGGVGNVYKGELDGIQIAVKRVSEKSKEGAQEFITAIGTISALKHPNLATLMGSCSEQNQLLLVYKYMENISLQHALFGSEEVKSKLNWETRFKICLGVAKGLACLHESKLKVIHSNIKPTNILLDKDFTVKISDFGYSQFHDPQLVDAQLNKDETMLGSLPKPKITGHMAPEQIQGLPLRPKADVYSFGIVTLEIVSGQEICTLRSKDSNDYLLNTAYKYQKQRNLIALVDPNLESNYKYKEALTMLCLAMECVNPSFDLRPTMSNVVKILEGNEKFDISTASKALVISDPKATFSQSTHSGSTSHEEASNTTISPSSCKEIDDSIKFADTTEMDYGTVL